MKKRWIFSALCVAAAVVMAVTYTTPDTTVTVKTTTLKTATVEQTVTCTGVVEAGEVQGVFPPLRCVIDEVLVGDGQAVKAGETIACINKDATRAFQQSGDRIGAALTLATIPSVITAPADGIVVSVETAAGSTLEEYASCVTLAAQEDLQVRVMIREKMLPSLEIGQTVRVSGVGFDKKRYDGKLTEISSAASAGTVSGERRVEGVVTLAAGQADASMRLGLTAKAKIIVSTVPDGLVIPYEAVRQAADGSRYVYTAENGVAVYHTLTPQEELTDGLLVDGAGLVGKRLVTEPDKVTADGMPLTVQEDGT